MVLFCDHGIGMGILFCDLGSHHKTNWWLQGGIC
jgi:hypothetical protein